MRKNFAPFVLLVLMLLACNYSNTSNTNNSNNSNNSNKNESEKAKGDFSTPKAAVETFIKAGTNRDADLLSRCFDASSPGEFRKYRDKTASQKEMDEMAEFVQDAQVTDVNETGDNAKVSVKFKKRNEEITMKKSADGWKIVDF